jgi:hypothetical protein
MNKHYQPFRQIVVLLVGFFASILMGLTSCNDANAQPDVPDVGIVSQLEVPQETINNPETQYITLSKQELEEILKKVVNAERKRYQELIKDPHLLKSTTTTVVSNSGNSSKTAVKASVSDVADKVGLVGTVTLNDDDDTIYDVFQGAKGGLYIFRLSKETGNEYKSYIKQDSKLYSRITWEK